MMNSIPELFYLIVFLPMGVAMGVEKTPMGHPWLDKSARRPTFLIPPTKTVSSGKILSDAHLQIAPGSGGQAISEKLLSLFDFIKSLDSIYFIEIRV